MVKSLPSRRCEFDPWIRKISLGRKQQPTPVFFPENPMVRGAWRVTVHGAAVGHDSGTELTRMSLNHMSGCSLASWKASLFSSDSSSIRGAASVSLRVGQGRDEISFVLPPLSSCT